LEEKRCIIAGIYSIILDWQLKACTIAGFRIEGAQT
jgi:hypothetical protein